MRRACSSRGASSAAAAPRSRLPLRGARRRLSRDHVRAPAAQLGLRRPPIRGFEGPSRAALRSSAAKSSRSGSSTSCRHRHADPLARRARPERHGRRAGTDAGRRSRPAHSFDYRFTPPDAGTFWYHAPSALAEDRALYGLLIVDEAERVDVDRDVALVLDACDAGRRPIDADGPHFTVNGHPALDIPVKPTSALRLRLLNAATRSAPHAADRPAMPRRVDGDRRPAGRAVSRRATAGSCSRPATASIFSSTRHSTPGSIAPIVRRHRRARSAARAARL